MGASNDFKKRFATLSANSDLSSDATEDKSNKIWTDIRELIAASTEIEKLKKKISFQTGNGFVQLVQPGSSLGGARPKASVIDTDKTLYIAKFPSREDDYDAGLWNTSVILTAKGWTLSPAYDMNPSLNEFQSLLITPTSSKYFD